MKKIIILLLILVLVIFFSNFLVAAPADLLQEVSFKGVTSDGANHKWERVYQKMSPEISLSGQKGYFVIFFRGYPNVNSIKIYNQGRNITNKLSQPLPDDRLVDEQGIIRGIMKYYSFPLTEVASGKFVVVARGINNFSNKKVDTLLNVKIKANHK